MNEFENIRKLQNLLHSINQESLNIQRMLHEFNTNDEQFGSAKKSLNNKLLLISKNCKHLKSMINNHISEIEELNGLYVLLNKNLEGTTSDKRDNDQLLQVVSKNICIDRDGFIRNL